MIYMRFREPGNTTSGDAQLVCISYSTPEEIEFNYRELMRLMDDPEIRRQRQIIEDADKEDS